MNNMKNDGGLAMCKQNPSMKPMKHRKSERKTLALSFIYSIDQKKYHLIWFLTCQPSASFAKWYLCLG